MLRRIILLRSQKSLGEAATAKSFSMAAAHLAKKIKVKGMEFVEEYSPVAYGGLGAAMALTAKASGFNYGGSLADSAYLVCSHFADQDAVARMMKDRNEQVLGVYADMRIAPFRPYCGADGVGEVRDVKAKLGVAALKKKKLTGKGVRVAIVDTGIDGTQVPVAGGWSPIPGATPGSSGPDHGTMCAFDATIAAPDAKILDYALLQSSGATWTAFLSDAIAGFADLMERLRLEPGPLVVNNSWGMFDRKDDAPIGSDENYSANPRHPFNEITAMLVAAGADVFFAAGNCGEDCPDGRCGVGDTGPGASIHGANSHPDVITVAAVTVEHRRLGYSSQGPGGLHTSKPDLSGYSHFVGSGVFDVDGGTSAASPVAAGVCAALRQKGKGRTFSPAQMKALLMRSAIDLGGAGWDADTGMGVINAAAALKALS